MVISKLKPGMRVYDIKRATGMQTFWSKWSTWTVFIEKVDIENNKVFASWNGNPSQWYDQRTWSKWRLKAPAPERI